MVSGFEDCLVKSCFDVSLTSNDGQASTSRSMQREVLVKEQQNGHDYGRAEPVSSGLEDSQLLRGKCVAQEAQRGCSRNPNRCRKNAVLTLDGSRRRSVKSPAATASRGAGRPFKRFGLGVIPRKEPLSTTDEGGRESN